ncbi:hypothetical protein PHYPSEUDO_015226 [Phytophthora pseudosyringae]|uniref:Uncharacterized protein n=1 Tax=Phytophthora pseudosyringae TaxID=221518 RepID=A0A8T1W2P5_9STRA|nr:hypothetical protein PHYPSEUDO_015226 [Phytophthora pseudosyringae]
MDEGVGDWNACDRTCGKRMFGPRGVLGRTMHGCQLRPHTVGSAASAIRRQRSTEKQRAPMTVQNKSCDPVNGTANESGQWGACDARSGKKAGSRTVKQLDLYGRSKFLGLTQEAPCYPVSCPIVFYMEWTNCTDAGATKSRSHQVTQKNLY